MNEHRIAKDEEFMREAIRLAIESVEKDGGPFGAVIVHDRNIVGRGANCVTAANDPTAHAEIVAIRQACANLDTFLLDDCECYATAEPCPMCLGALYWARIPRVYYGCSSRDAQDIGFDDTRIYRELCIPIPQRDIRMHQMLRKEALSAFRLWREKSDKIPY